MEADIKRFEILVCMPKTEVMVDSFLSVMYSNTLSDKISGGQYFRQQAIFSALLSAGILSDKVFCLSFSSHTHVCKQQNKQEFYFLV